MITDGDCDDFDRLYDDRPASPLTAVFVVQTQWTDVNACDATGTSDWWDDASSERKPSKKQQ